MTLTIWLSFFTICLLGAMSPGPSLAVVLKQTINNSRAHGLAACWFHAAGVCLWAMATVSGLAVVVSQSPLLYTAITWMGAIYLAWMGFRAFRAGSTSSLKIGPTDPVSIWRAGMEGAMISVLNPKLAVFFIALFSQFIAKDATLSDHVMMVITATLVDGIWYTLVAIVLTHGPILTALQKRSQGINRVTGVVLVLLALRVITL